MREIEAFLKESGFVALANVTLNLTAEYIEAFRPCGPDRLRYPPQPFRCRTEPLPVVILKQRPMRSKAIATIVVLPNKAVWYRKGGVSSDMRAGFESLKMGIRTHERRPGEAGYDPLEA